jgi:hypothetical protein
MCEDVCCEWEIYFVVTLFHNQLNVKKIRGLLIEIFSWKYLVKMAWNEEAQIRDAFCLQTVYG